MRNTIIACLLAIIMIVPAYAASGDDVTSLSVSIINQDPDPAIAGEVVEIRLGFENIGENAASDMMLELDPAYPFTLAPGEDSVNELGTISGYQSGDNMKIVKLKVFVDRKANAGTYDLIFKYYQKESQDIFEKSVSVDIKNRESAEVIHIDKSTLVPGKESSLKFTITNVGNAPLKDMTFHWENEDMIILPVRSDNTKYIDYIDVGKSKDLEYKVIADTNAVAGLYALNLHLTYEDPITGSETSIDTIAGLYVGGGTDFDLAFSESSAGETSFSVANIGSNPATSVSVIIPQQKGWRVSGSNSVIIGNLNKGDYTVASFTLQSSSQ